MIKHASKSEILLKRSFLLTIYSTNSSMEKKCGGKKPFLILFESSFLKNKEGLLPPNINANLLISSPLSIKFSSKNPARFSIKFSVKLYVTVFCIYFFRAQVIKID